MANSAESSHQYRFRFGEFELDPLSRELRTNGRIISLQEQSFQILAVLLEHPGQLVTRDELTKKLWPPGTFVDFGHSLNTAVNRLREVLGDSAESPRFIETLPRLGYRFIAPVANNASDERGAVAEASLLSECGSEGRTERGQNGSVPIARGITKSSPQVQIAQRTWISTAALVLTLIVVAGFTGYVLHRWISRTSTLNFERLRFTKLTSSGKAEDAAISPDGNYIVYAQEDRQGSGLWLRHVSSGSDVQILPSEEIDFRGLTFSPDGNTIYFVRTRKDTGSFKDLYAMPIFGGAYRLLTRDIDAPVSFSPDGHRFVYTRGMPSPEGNEIPVANADGSEDRRLATITGTSGNFQAGGAWSPNGTTIAVSLMMRGQRSGYVLDSVSALDGSVREVFWNAGVIGRPLWLPESDKVLVDVDDATGRGQLWMITFPQGKRRRVTNDLANWGIRIDTTRDAKKVAAIQWSLSANIWEGVAANPSEAKPISSGEAPLVAAVQGTPGKILAVSADGQLWIMNKDGAERRPFSNLRDVAPPVMCGQFCSRDLICVRGRRRVANRCRERQCDKAGQRTLRGAALLSVWLGQDCPG